jgi:hypothetical protein
MSPPAFTPDRRLTVSQVGSQPAIAAKWQNGQDPPYLLDAPGGGGCWSSKAKREKKPPSLRPLPLRKCAADRVCGRKQRGRGREGGCVSDLQGDFTPGLCALMQWANHTAAKAKPCILGSFASCSLPLPRKEKGLLRPEKGDSEAKTR